MANSIADRIRGMGDTELNGFLFRFKVDAIVGFIQDGGAGVMDALKQKEWLQYPAEALDELLDRFV